ncbi:MAG: PIN domain-containing protein [Clostridiaceae bacterium]|nr:PIN domain-containing protein [Clostridiaceae bacterium]
MPDDTDLMFVDTNIIIYAYDVSSIVISIGPFQRFDTPICVFVIRMIGAGARKITFNMCLYLLQRALKI